jgi:hypothetical protein
MKQYLIIHAAYIFINVNMLSVVCCVGAWVRFFF